MKKILLQRKGFTLVELMVTIAIIGILTAIVTSNFTAAKARSRDAKRISDIAQIQLALSLFFDKCNAYPLTIYTTGNVGTSATCVKSDGLTTVYFGDYISVVPTDPSTGSVYTYRNTLSNPCTANCTSATNYVLATLLEGNTTALVDSLKTIPSGIKKVSGSGPLPNTMTVSGTDVTACTGMLYCVTSN